ncbi:MAG: hypothetical protein HY823_08680 [Acidobacteria bacterium]|nr:hypothetical protein [Acidobacteriota bacterium]
MRSLALLPVTVVLISCGAESPEAQVRKAFGDAVKAVEAGDAAGAVEVLHPEFQGPEGMNKAEARAYLFGWLRQEKVGVTVIAQRLELKGPVAMHSADLLLTGRRGGLIPEESSRRTLVIRWELRDKRWRIREIRTPNP